MLILELIFRLATQVFDKAAIYQSYDKYASWTCMFTQILILTDYIVDDMLVVSNNTNG